MLSHVYRDALRSCERELDVKKGALGLEGIVHRALAEHLPGSESEATLSALGGKQITNSRAGRVDIVWRSHGIELKVVRLPRLEATPSNALYDIGQLASDYWRLSETKKLTSAELVVLLYGPLVGDLDSTHAIYREFHNRMYVDYITSLEFGELKVQKREMRRVRQIDAITRMGFSKPCSRKVRPTFRQGAFALVSINVES